MSVSLKVVIACRLYNKGLISCYVNQMWGITSKVTYFDNVALNPSQSSFKLALCNKRIIYKIRFYNMQTSLC